MTESEYVNHILQRAKAYIADIGKDPGTGLDSKINAEWYHTKTMLSANTVVRLCETWLEAENGSGE